MNKSSRARVVSRLKQNRLMWACGAKIVATHPNLLNIFTKSRLLPSAHVLHADAEQKYCPACKRAKTFVNLTINMII